MTPDRVARFAPVAIIASDTKREPGCGERVIEMVLRGGRFCRLLEDSAGAGDAMEGAIETAKLNDLDPEAYR